MYHSDFVKLVDVIVAKFRRYYITKIVLLIFLRIIVYLRLLVPPS
jgi:hypothetical protein